MSVTSSLRPELQLKIDAQGINGRKYLQSNQEERQDVHHRVNGERQTNSLVHSSHEFEHNKEQRASNATVPNTCVQSSKGDNIFIDVSHERKANTQTDEEANSAIHSSYHHHEEQEQQQQHEHEERQQEESKLTITNNKSNNIVNNTMTTNNNIATAAKSKELVQEPEVPGTVEAQIMNNVEISLNTSKAKLVIPTLQIPHVLASSPPTSVSKGMNINTNFVDNAYENKENYANVDNKASNEAVTATTSTYNTTELLHKELSDEVKSLRKSAIRHLRRLFGPLVMRRVLRARRYRKYEAFALEHFYTVHDVSYILSIYSSLSSSRATHLEDTNATTDATTTTTGLYHLTPPSLLTSSHITRTQRHLPQALSESFLSECPRDFCESLACMAVFTPVRRSWWVVYPHESHLSAGIVVLLNGTLREVEVYTGKSTKSHGTVAAAQNTAKTNESETVNAENSNEQKSDKTVSLNNTDHNEGKSTENTKNSNTTNITTDSTNKQTTHKSSTGEVSNPPRRRYKVIREHTAPAVLCVNAVLGEDCNDSGFVVSAKANAYVAIIPSREF